MPHPELHLRSLLGMIALAGVAGGCFARAIVVLNTSEFICPAVELVVGATAIGAATGVFTGHPFRMALAGLLVAILVIGLFLARG